MAENPDLNVKIVPCGLSYFHPHRFRSRAGMLTYYQLDVCQLHLTFTVIEFGRPIDIPSKLVMDFKLGGQKKRDACAELLQTIFLSLRAVTINAPDYDALQVFMFVFVSLYHFLVSPLRIAFLLRTVGCSAYLMRMVGCSRLTPMEHTLLLSWIHAQHSSPTFMDPLTTFIADFHVSSHHPHFTSPRPQVIQAARRLYVPRDAFLSMPQKLELTRHFSQAYEKLMDKPKVKNFTDKVLRYNQLLMTFGIRDHQVEKTALNPVRALWLLLFRVGKLVFLTTLMLPGLLLNGPIALFAVYFSKKKAQGKRGRSLSD